MNVIEILDQVDHSDVRGQETVIHFEEGLIGFSNFKNFNLLENDYLAPFRLLRAVGSRPTWGFSCSILRAACPSIAS